MVPSTFSPSGSAHGTLQNAQRQGKGLISCTRLAGRARYRLAGIAQTTQGKRGLGTGGGDSRFALLHVCSASHILVNQCHDGPLHVLTAIITNERHQKIDGILDLVLLSGMWVGQKVTVPLHVLSDATVHLGEDTHLVAPASWR